MENGKFNVEHVVLDTLVFFGVHGQVPIVAAVSEMLFKIDELR